MVGEHIRVLKGGRWVHAVDCGDETVLHLVESAPPPRVRRAYRPEFVAAGAVEVVTHRERTFPRKEIVRRAYSRASDPALASMFRDSEAFVEWCTTGRLPGSHHAALEAPGVTTTPAKGAPARPAAKTKGKTKAKASARKPAAKAAARRPARPKAKARKPGRPAAKAKRRAQRKPARAAPARRGRKPARKSRR